MPGRGELIGVAGAPIGGARMRDASGSCAAMADENALVSLTGMDMVVSSMLS